MKGFKLYRWRGITRREQADYLELQLYSNTLQKPNRKF